MGGSPPAERWAAGGPPRPTGQRHNHVMSRAWPINGCIRPALARTWWRPHWKHWRRYGDREQFAGARPRRPLEERFWEKVERADGPQACWPWLASRDALRYGIFRVLTDQP